MESIKIGEIVSIAQSYTSEVNIWFDYNNPEMNELKVRGFIPTAPALKALGLITQGFMPLSDHRVHLITGMYGKGKSHLGLILANIFRHGPNNSLVAEFISHVERVDANTATLISRNRNGIAGDFLIVVLKPSSDPGGFNHVLLAGLQDALEKAKIEYTPKTRFSGAVGILDMYAQDPTLKARFDQELAKQRTDMRILRANLQAPKVEAYELFCLVYEAVIHTPYQPEYFGDPAEVYLDVVRHIRGSANLAGILVIADEFGTHLSQLARDSSGQEAMAVQNFVEFCKRTREDQVHFLAIAHRTLADYAVGLESQEEWKRVSGRFIEREYNLDVAGGNNYEIVELISNVLYVPQNATHRNHLWPTIHAGLAHVADWVRETKLFGEQHSGWIEAKLLAGCYPLHPAATFCLPWLAQRVGQANRTAFKFLESNEPGGLQKFMNDSDVLIGESGIRLYTPDRLIEYFGRGATESTTYRGTMAARTTALAACGTDELAIRLIDLMAVLEIVKQPALPSTRVMLVSVLAQSPKEFSDLERSLENLVTQHVIRPRPNGRFELMHHEAGEIDAQEAILKIKETARANFGLVDDLSERANLQPILAHGYEEQYGVLRTAERRLVSPRHLDNLESYRVAIKEKYSPGAAATQNADALILYVLARDETEIVAARSRLTSGTGSDQLIVALPKRPFEAGETLLELRAIRELRGTSRLLDGRIDNDDLARAEQDRQDQAKLGIAAYFRAENFNWYYSSNVATAVISNDEESLVSSIMRSVFDKTPVIRDEVLMASKNTKSKDRQNAMQRLLEINAPLQILKQLGLPPDRMLRAALRDTELLDKRSDLGTAEEFEVRLNAPENSTLVEVWGFIRKKITNPDVPVPLGDIVGPLLAPPYGLSRQLIELLLAAALRTVKDQCAVLGGHTRAVKTRNAQAYQAMALTAENIPKFVREADDYVLTYYEILPAQRGFVRMLMTTLDPEHKPGLAGGLLEQAREVLLSWFGRLPQATRLATDLNAATQRVARLLNEVDKAPDAKTLITDNLPEALLGQRLTLTWTDRTNLELESAFRQVYEDSENYILGRTLRAIEQLCDVFETSGRTQGDLDVAARNWYSGLPEFRRQHHFAGDSGHLVSAITGGGDIVQRFLVKLPESLGLAAFTSWNDASVGEMLALKLKVAKTLIETLTPPQGDQPDPGKVLDPAMALGQQLRTLLSMSDLTRDIKVEILQSLLTELGK